MAARVDDRGAGAELVGHSADAQTAITDLSVLEPDLILLDIRLKAGIGFDVLKALQERHLLPTAMKAVLTNHANAEYEQLSFRLGADHFFDKSSETSHVLPLIGALVADRQRGGKLPRLAGASAPLDHVR